VISHTVGSIKHIKEVYGNESGNCKRNFWLSLQLWNRTSKELLTHCEAEVHEDLLGNAMYLYYHLLRIIICTYSSYVSCIHVLSYSKLFLAILQHNYLPAGKKEFSFSLMIEFQAQGQIQSLGALC